jgi:hypothetical protein
MTEETPELTIAEKEELAKILSTAPVPDEKHTVFTFLDNVAKAKDTTKTGFLKDEEIGMLRNPTRAYKKIALDVKYVMGNDELSEYFNQMAETVTSTSLSRNAMLLRLAITTQKQIADVTKAGGQKKGILGNLFGCKKETTGGNPLQ